MPRTFRWTWLGALALATSPTLALGQGLAPGDSSKADSTKPAPPVYTYAPADSSSTPSLRELTRPRTDDPPRLFGPAPTETLQETLRAYTEQPYRPLRASEFYSSGFLTEGQKLPYGKVLGPVTPPQIPANAANVPALPFWILGVEAPRGAAYQIGDSLLAAQLGRPMRSFGEVVEPTGLLRVTDTTQGRYLVEVIAVYGSILPGQQVLPLEKFTPGGSARAVPVSDGVRAKLLGGPRRQEVKTPQMVVFLDKGRRDGVAAGDIFELRRRAEKLSDGSLRADELMATLQIVHVREHTATGRLLRIISSDIEPGTTARQVAKLAS